MKIKPLIKSVDVSTRHKRKVATLLAIELLEQIRFAEEKYLERIPCNLKNSCVYATAEDTVDILISAIVTLLSAYD